MDYKTRVSNAIEMLESNTNLSKEFLLELAIELREQSDEGYAALESIEKAYNIPEDICEMCGAPIDVDGNCINVECSSYNPDLGPEGAK